MATMPSKKVCMKILTAYGGGVANITGAQYTAFGRDREVARFNQTLKMTREASGRMELFIGPYGVGKSFVLSLFQALAVKKNYVVMSADLTASKWFAGTATEKQGLNLYRDLIKNTTIKGCPTNANAFDVILRNWYDDLVEKTGGGFSEIMMQFNKDTEDCRYLTMYNDIRNAILSRFKEFQDGVSESKAIEFFLANITKKTDAKAIGAADYIRDAKWFDVMNTYSHIFSKAGYAGLILLFDQADYILNLSKNDRQQNYETMLTMWNAINEGRTEYLSIMVFASENLVDDPKRGTIQYQALDDRLKGANRLDVLSDDYMVALLLRLCQIHETAYSWESKLTEDDARDFVQEMLPRTGMSRNCIRPITVAWIKKLDDMQVGNVLDSDVYENMVESEVAKNDELSGIPESFPEDRWPS